MHPVRARPAPPSKQTASALLPLALQGGAVVEAIEARHQGQQLLATGLGLLFGRPLVAGAKAGVFSREPTAVSACLHCQLPLLGQSGFQGIADLPVVDIVAQAKALQLLAECLVRCLVMAYQGQSGPVGQGESCQGLGCPLSTSDAADQLQG